MNDSSELRSSGFSPNASPNNPRQPPAALSVPPTESLSPSASPMSKDGLDPGNTTVDYPALQVNRLKRRPPVQYTLFQGGNSDEDCGPPTKELKTLKTTWNCTSAPSSEVSRYLDERKLELSRITRRTMAARLRYQRLRAHELDLIKSILEDEKDMSQKQLNDIDLQIGGIQDTLQDGGITVIEDKGRRFDSSDHTARFASALEARDDAFMSASESDAGSSCMSGCRTST